MKSLGRFGLLAGLVAVALVVALAVVFWPGAGKRHLVAEFPRTISLYKGSDVRILGVPVGKVDDVKPVGTHVNVKISYDDTYKLPKDAKAAIVAPSIVGDRYVQLTPVYKGGPVMADNATIAPDHTATPLELDQIFGSLNDLDKALGPDGANKPDGTGVGPLTRLLSSTAANFGGQGEQFNQTIRNVGDLTQTLDENKTQLFATQSQLEKFTNKLAVNDQTVRRFNDSLAAGSGVLAGERQELAQMLSNLSVALREVRGFVHHNRAALGSNIRGLNKISQILVKRRDATDKILSWAPGALNNLALAGDTTTGGTLDTRDNVGELGNLLSSNPGTVLCTFVGQTDAGKQACPSIQNALKSAGLGRPAALSGEKSGGGGGGPTVVEPVDKSLGGLVSTR